MRYRIELAVVVVVVGTLMLAPAWAEEGDRRVRFGAFAGFPTDDLEEAGETIEVDDTIGFHAGVEFMVTDTIGIEPVVGFSNHDVEVEVTGSVPEVEFKLGEVDLITLVSNVNFHVVRKDKIAVYIGPTVGYALWGDLETDLFTPGQKIKTDDEFLFGGNAGIDVPFGEGGWGFSAGLSYLFTDLTLDGASGPDSDLGVDPLLLKLGVSKRF